MPGTPRWLGIVVTGALLAALLTAAATWVLLGAPDWSWVALGLVAGGTLGVLGALGQCVGTGRR